MYHYIGVTFNGTRIEARGFTPSEARARAEKRADWLGSCIMRKLSCNRI